MSETKQQDLTRMLGVWLTRDGGIAVPREVKHTLNDCPIYGVLLQENGCWSATGGWWLSNFYDEGSPGHLHERLGDLDDLRRGADVLMQRREYVTAAVVYQLLGDEEGVERAVRERREEIERERQADADKPF